MGAKQYPRTPTPQTRAQKNRTTSSTSSLPSRDTGRPNPYTIMYANTRRQTRKRVAQRPTQRDNESPMGRWSEHSREPALPAQQRQKGKLGAELLTYTKWNQTHFLGLMPKPKLAQTKPTTDSKTQTTNATANRRSGSNCPHYQNYTTRAEYTPRA